MPDVLAWWGGGQTGYLHSRARWFIGSPLTLVSTWDGDELSLVRQHHQLRAARHLDVAAAAAALDAALASVTSVGPRRVPRDRRRRAAARSPTRSPSAASRVRRFPNGRLGIIPALDQLDARALGRAAGGC